MLCALAALMAACMLAPKRAPRGVDTLVIVHANDMHAQLRPDKQGNGGMARIATIVKSLKAERPDVLALCAGDTVQGDAVSTIFKGSPIFEIANTIGFDASTLGNHEFDYGLEQLAEFRRIAEFPLLCCDILRGKKYIADAPGRIFNVDGVRVGVAGVTTHEDIARKGLTFLPIEAAVREQVEALRPRSDLIVVLSHLGKEKDIELAEAVEGIDVIVGGHSHDAIETPIEAGGALIVQAGARARYAGRLDLAIDLDSGEILSFEGRLIPADAQTVAPDPEAQALIDSWEAKVAETVETIIGQNPQALDTEQTTQALCRIWSEVFGTDFATSFSGSIRGGLPQGELRVRDFYNVLPFDNTMFILQLTRDEAAEFVEGAQFAEDKPLYSVAVNDYNGQQMIERLKLPEERIERTGVNWRDAILEHVKENGSLAPAAAAAR